MRGVVEEILVKYSHANRDSLIPILQEIQDELGYLSEDAVVKVASHIGVATSKIYGLATFYNQFRFQPKGKYHFQICQGTTCHLMGTLSILELLEKRLKIKAGQTSRNGNYSLEVVPCMGACALSPVITLNGTHYGRMTKDALIEILDKTMVD